MTATLTKWYDERGRHQIYAGNKKVELENANHSLVLNPEAVAAAAQTDLDEAGIAKTARDEKLQARSKAKRTPEEVADDSRMEALYRQHVLKEQPNTGLLQIKGLKVTEKLGN
jgi:7,8-dihydro-6-hydroxymethylpterin dimethyltransferase